MGEKKQQQTGNDDRRLAADDSKSVNLSIDKEAKKELQKHKNRFQQLEEKIAQLNKRKAELETAMASPDSYANKASFQQTETEYKTVTTDLDKAAKEYETVFEKLMELEDKMG